MTSLLFRSLTQFTSSSKTAVAHSTGDGQWKRWEIERIELEGAKKARHGVKERVLYLGKNVFAIYFFFFGVCCVFSSLVKSFCTRITTGWSSTFVYLARYWDSINGLHSSDCSTNSGPPANWEQPYNVCQSKRFRNVGCGKDKVWSTKFGQLWKVNSCSIWTKLLCACVCVEAESIQFCLP